MPLLLRLLQIPVLTDNTAWLLVEGARAVVVDPPEPAPVLEAIAREGARLTHILTTHHHADHTGANLALVHATGAVVVGNAHDRARIPALAHAVVPGDRVTILDRAFRVLDVHAHTRAHIAFALDAPVDVVVRHGHAGAPRVVDELAHRPALFVGDALFLMGCGRLFEGTPDDLTEVMRTLAREDPRALVCCTHEYTRANCAFAQTILDDEAVRARGATIEATFTRDASTLPGTLGEERASNPYLRALDDTARPLLARALGLDDGAPVVDVIGALRRAKDTFQG